MENLKAVFTAALEAAAKVALPVLAGFLVGVAAGGALMWWIFL